MTSRDDLPVRVLSKHPRSEVARANFRLPRARRAHQQQTRLFPTLNLTHEALKASADVRVYPSGIVFWSKTLDERQQATPTQLALGQFLLRGACRVLKVKRRWLVRELVRLLGGLLGGFRALFRGFRRGRCDRRREKRFYGLW